MKPFFAVLKKELLSYFFSPLAYVILTAFLILNGGIFYLILSYLNSPTAPHGAVLKAFFGGTIFYWLYILFIIPALTMRSISEEKRLGTLETLMTSPITETQVILSKFFASLIIYLFLWLFTIIYVIILISYTSIDLMPVLTGYIGIILHGSAFLSAGILASSFSRNQIISAIWAFVILIILFTFGFLYQLVPSPKFKNIIEYATLWEQMEWFGKGIIDTRGIIYSLSLIVLFLFLSVQVLKFKKWR
jgi:ABC-2 type transport system permease protein